MSEFLELASIKEEKADSVPPQLEMVEKVVDDFEFLIISLNQAAEKIQSEYNDEVTFGQLLNLSEKYQKHSWMLKSLIQK
jgi:DNA-binding ferritin-like protein